MSPEKAFKKTCHRMRQAACQACSMPQAWYPSSYKTKHLSLSTVLVQLKTSRSASNP